MAKNKEAEKQKNFSEELDALRKELNADNRPEEIYIPSGSFTLDIHLGGKGWKCGRLGEIKAWEGCLCENTYIKYIVESTKTGLVQSCNGGSIKSLYDYYHNTEDSKRHKSTKDSNIYVTGINEYDRIIRNPIADVIKSGQKECFKITTKSGFTIEATKDHKFYNGTLYLPVELLRIGEYIHIHNNTHHKDENKRNDVISNLELLNPIEHARFHALERQNNLRFISVPDEIISIESVGIKETYDIKCFYPYNNFIANGFVVHNSGKTTICLHLIKECQKAGLEYAYIDAEQALNPDYARKIGIDWEHFKKRLFQPANGEESFELIKRLIKTGECRVIIGDSTSGMLPQVMMEGEAGKSNLGLHARLFSGEIPKIKHLADKYNTLVIFISQIREKIGVMFGSPETTQAGNALKFFDDYLIEIRKKIDSENGKEEDATGITSNFHIIKNKTYEPYHKGSFHIVKMEGIDNIREVMDIADELEIIKVWGKTTTYPTTEDGTKYDTDTFYQFLEDNPELVEQIKHDCLVKLNLI